MPTASKATTTPPKATNLVRIPATRVVQHGTELWVGSLTKEIRARLTINRETFDPHAKVGYQRLIDLPRVGGIVQYVSEMRRLLPTALLVNFRPADVTLKIETVDEDHAYILVQEGTVAYVYDGQHRDTAVTKAWDEGLEGFALAAVYSNLPPIEELYHFNVINSTCKGVDRTVVEEGIIQWQHANPEKDAKKLLPSVMRSDYGILAASYRLAEGINRDEDSPWKDKFTLPNSKRRKGSMDEGKVQKYFQCIIRNRDSVFPTIPDVQILMLKNFGKALQNKCPKSFESPDQYLLLRHLGMEFLGKLLPILMHYINSPGIPTTEQFETALEKMILPKFGNVMVDTFWHSKDGQAKHYHGTVNVSELIEDVRKVYEPTEPTVVA